MAQRPFYVPAMLDKILREPVEQFGVRGRRSLQAQIIRRADDSRAKHHLPNAIHRHASEQRIRWGRQPLG